MGTPNFAVASLKALIEKNYEIAAVFTQPDKPKGRGHKMQFSPVKELAIENGIQVLQPIALRDEEIQNQIIDLNPDFIVVAAYGKLLPKVILDIPKFGCINVHGSLLPKYRGAAPIQWAVINGEKTTGITTMYMAEGLDTGDICKTAETSIGENETAAELFVRLEVIGADLLIETLSAIENNECTRVPQNDEDATFAPMLKKEMAIIDWQKSAKEIKNLVHGLNPWPYANSVLLGKKMKILAAKVHNLNGNVGEITKVNGKFIVFCGDGALELVEIQPENGKRMSGESYLLGHQTIVGEKFE